MSFEAKKNRYAYDLAATNYEAKFCGYDIYLGQVKAFASMFEIGSSVLDLGCGPGINSKIFSDCGLKLTGVDISEEMVKLAKVNCPAGSFFVSSVNDFSPNLKFDGLCLSFIIVHLKKEEVVELISRIPNLLKEAGKVYISFIVGDGSGYEKTCFSDNEIFFSYFSPKFVISCFNEVGLNLISSNCEPYENSDGSMIDELFLVFE